MHAGKNPWRSFKRIAVCGGWMAAALASQACMNPDPDLYSTVVADCDYLPNNVETSLREPCKVALEKVIPFDEASFAAAPAGAKYKVEEAFYTLVAYHLKPPARNAILGVTPSQAGAVSDKNWSIFERASNPNQSAFNYVLSHMDKVTYTRENPNGDLLVLNSTLVSNSRDLVIYDNFVNAAGSPFLRLHESFVRASLLLHEARHGDSVEHGECRHDSTIASGRNVCDAGMNGPWGLQFLYFEFLIAGSSTTDPLKLRAPLIPSDYSLMAQEICTRTHESISYVFPELYELLRGVNCNHIEPEWVAAQEGIMLPPFWF